MPNYLGRRIATLLQGTKCSRDIVNIDPRSGCWPRTTPLGMKLLAQVALQDTDSLPSQFAFPAAAFHANQFLSVVSNASLFYSAYCWQCDRQSSYLLELTTKTLGERVVVEENDVSPRKREEEGGRGRKREEEGGTF
eukprot:597369-Rhodomonas_salina.1